ncbi:MAG: ATP-binding protein, partial [Candidatus Limnocylindria bacterium]
EDDALRAVKAAATVRDRVTGLGGELAEELGRRLEVRIGVNSGEVVAADPGSGHGFVTGDAVNVAARLEQLAEPSEILLGERTYELVRHAVTAEPSGELTLKGKATGVAAWRLLGIGPESPTIFMPAAAPLVGRREELALLRGALQRAIDTRTCQLGTVLGEPGIGKSRLARELIDHARPTWQVVIGRCLSYGEGITFWPLAEVVRQLAPDDGLDGVLAHDPDGPLVGTRIRGAIGTGGSPGPAEETSWAFRRLFEQVAKQQPLIVVVDDIHWAEPALLDVLEYVVDYATDAPLLLLCLARPELRERRPSWVERQGSAVLTLGPLADADAAQLVAGLSPAGTLAPAERDRLIRAAEGNALFLEQIVAHQLEHGGDQATVPPSVEALLAARIDLLGPDERAVVVRAAVEGREFHRGAVRELLGATGPTSIDTTLQALVAKGFVEPGQAAFPGEDGFRFGHQLIREAAYAASSKALRVDLHRRYADWLEGQAMDRVTEYEEIIGYHLEQAYRFLRELRQPDERLGERAAERLGSAGERALARGDTRAATNLLERAAEIAGERTSPAVWHALGVARMQAGDLAGAADPLAKAVARAEEIGDQRAAARAAIERAGLGNWTGELTADAVQAETERAIAVLEPMGDELGMAKAWLNLVQIHNMRLEIGRWERAGGRALEHARRAGSPPDQAQAIMWRCGALLLGVLPVTEAIGICEDMRTDARGPLAEAAVLQVLGPLRMMAGQVAEGRELFDRSQQIHLDLGMRLVATLWTTARSLGELAAAEFAAAEAVLRGSIQSFQEMGERGALSTQAALLAHALCSLGRHAEATPYLDLSLETSGPQDLINYILVPAGRARVLAAAGDGEAALRAAREGVELVDRTDATDIRAMARVALAEAFAATNQPREEAVVRREMLELYEQRGFPVLAALARERLTALGSPVT